MTSSMFVITSPSTDEIRFRLHLRALLDELRIGHTSLNAELDQPETGDDVSAARLLVGRVKLYIDEHAGEALDLDRIAREAHRSKYHLSRLFREAEDQTLWAYVLEARVRQAERLLEETDASLAEIAYRTGFSDQSHFTRIFKQHTGQTPGQYRRDLRV